MRISPQNSWNLKLNILRNGGYPVSERIISEFETKANKCKNCMVCQSGEINSDVIKTKMKPILYMG